MTVPFSQNLERPIQKKMESEELEIIEAIDVDHLFCFQDDYNDSSLIEMQNIASCTLLHFIFVNKSSFQ